MKKTICVISALITLASFSLRAYAAECSWYIKRNGTHRPSCPVSEEIMDKYDVYFLDKKLNDASEEKRLYLTFDLGYVNDSVLRILDVLEESETPAAFFILDHVIYKNADMLKRMVNDGHLICNHTKRHKNLSNSTEEEIRADLGALESLYKEKTGREMSKYFRFPEGKYSEAALASICKMGYKTIFWSFAYADWDNANQPKEEAAIKKILDNTHNGAVILLHPTSATNAKILGRVIAEWRKMGYTFGTLDDLTSQ